MSHVKFKRKKSFYKRFLIKPSGLIKGCHSFRRHILSKKSSKIKRFLKKNIFMSKADLILYRKLIF